MLAVLFAATIVGHPAALECMTDSANRLAVGQKIMGLVVQKAVAPAPFTVAVDGGVTEFLPGVPLKFSFSGLPKGAYFALRASGNVGTFSALSSGLAMTEDCVSQIYQEVPKSGDDPAASGTFEWTAPCDATTLGTDSMTVNFTAVWSTGPSVTPSPYMNITDSVTLKKSSAWDCVQVLGPLFKLAWKLDTKANTLTQQLNYSGPAGWLGLGLAALNDTAMLAPKGAQPHTAVIFLPSGSAGDGNATVAEYVLADTNAAAILKNEFEETELTGVLHSVTSGTNPHTSYQFTRPIKPKAGTSAYAINTTGANSILFAAGADDTFKQHTQQGIAAVYWAGAPPPPPPAPPPSPPPSPPSPPPSPPSPPPSPKPPSPPPSPPPTPPKPPPSPPPSPPAPSNKCLCCNVYCTQYIDGGKGMNISLSWRLDDKSAEHTIHVILDVPQLGWVGFGLPKSESSIGMDGSYAVIARPDEDVVEEWSLPAASGDAYSKLVPLKNGSAAFTDAEVSQIDGHTILSFRRTVNASGDPNRLPFKPNALTSNSTQVVMVVAGKAWKTTHSFPVAKANFSWFSQHSGATPSPSTGNLNTTLVTLHGIAMVVAWGVLIPFGIVMAKNKVGTKTDKGFWFKVHRFGNALGCILTFAGFAAIALAYKHAKDPNFVIIHAKIGLAVVVLAGFQPLNALARPPVNTAQTDAHAVYTRKVWEIVHKAIGYMTTALAWANIVLAFQLPLMVNSPALQSLKTWLQPAFFAAAGLAIFAGFLMEIVCVYKQKPTTYDRI